MDNNIDSKINTREIIGPEIARFEQYLKYNSKDNESWDGITPRLFWKLFYLKHKHLVFWHENKLYKISTDPFKLHEINTQHGSVFLDYNTKEKWIQNIIIILIILILFGTTSVLEYQYSFPLREGTTQLITWALIFILYLSFKIPRLIYILRFKLLKK